MNVNAGHIIIIFFLIGCNSETQTINTINENPEYSAAVEEKITRIISNLQAETAIDGIWESRSLAGQMTTYNTPGVSIAVINDWQVEWARGYGIKDLTTNEAVDVRTLFEAGSVSKPVFALGVMLLKERGALDIDADVNQYLKSWRVPANGDWQPRITLRQLLSHTAGMTVHGFLGYNKTEALPTIQQILDGALPANNDPVRVNLLPGSTYRYSGGGTTIAQLTVTDIEGKPFTQIMREELFDPLGLDYSTYEQPIPEELDYLTSTAHPYKNQAIPGRYHVYPEMAAAGLWSNPFEIATMVIEVQKALKDGSVLFSKESIEEMLTPQKAAPHIGIGFFLESKGDSLRFGHGGWDEGFVTEVTAYKNQGKGAVIMINSNEGYSIIDEIMRAIAIEYKWPDYISAPAETQLSDDDEMAGYAGTYSSENSELKITVDENRLTLRFEKQEPIKLLKSGNGFFKSDQLNIKVTFRNGELALEQYGKTVAYKLK